MNTLLKIFKPRYSKTHGIPCGYCHIRIFKEHEAGGQIRYLDDKPICARDRILHGAMGDTIKADKWKRDAQMEAAERRAHEAADKKAIHIAEVTQTNTGTKRKLK